MIKVKAYLCCECCTVEMYFNSLKSAEEAFKKSGDNEVVVDDKGDEYYGVNTYIGYFQVEGEQ